MKNLALIIAVALSATGCAVKKNYGSMGGSKSDGTVIVGYQHGAFEQPEVNDNQANAVAEQRCKAWGYNKAESFDFVNKECAQYSQQYGCTRYTVKRTFQCVD